MLAPKERHLTGAAREWMHTANITVTQTVAMPLRNALRPTLEARAIPFKAMIGMAKAVRRHFEQRVVLSIWRGDDHRARAYPREDRLLDLGQFARIDVLDGLDQDGAIEAGEAVIWLGQRALAQLDPAGLLLFATARSLLFWGERGCKPSVWLRVGSGNMGVSIEPRPHLFKALGIEVQPQDAFKFRLPRQAHQHIAIAAAKIEQAAGAARAHGIDHRLKALFVKFCGGFVIPVHRC